MTESRALVTSATDPDVAAAMAIFDRLKPLKDALGLDKLTDGEIQLFAMVASHTGLDPFTKQIYAIKRGGKVTHQTGIDGHRSTAEGTKQYRGSDEAEYEMCDCGDKGSPPVHPALARVVIHRAYPDGIRPQIGIARWHELKPDHKQNYSGNGYQDDMWWAMPFNQLAKCAEAAGLRKAFPRVLGGVYIAEEMQQADVSEGTATEVAPTAEQRMADKRAAAQAPKVEPVKVEPLPIPESARPVDAPDVIEGEVVESPAEAPETPDPHAMTFGESHPCKLHAIPIVQDAKGGWYCPDCKAPR